MNFRRTINKAGLATAVAGALAIGMFTNGHPAFAYSVKAAAGQPGMVQVPVTKGDYNGAGWPHVTFPARYVWRSGASADTQVVSLTYRVWKYNQAGGWPLYTSHTESARIAAGGPGAWSTGWYFNVALDSFAVNVQINWTALDGTLLGWKVIDYNAAADYQCLTGSTCSVLPNATVGAFIYLHPAPQPTVRPQPTQSTQSTTNSSTFTVGGTNVDLSVGQGTSGSTTTVVGGTSFDAVDRFYSRDLDLRNFGLGVSSNSQTVSDSLARWIASHSVINAYPAFANSIHLPL